MIKVVLAHADYHVVEASNDAHGLAKAGDQLTNGNMPIMNGIELILSLRKELELGSLPIAPSRAVR